jgi:hypothetical protein
VAEQVDGVGEDVRVLADEDHPVFQHDQREQIQEVIEIEHAQNRIDPFSGEVHLGIVPVGEQGDLLLVDEAQFVLLVEADLLVL